MFHVKRESGFFYRYSLLFFFLFAYILTWMNWVPQLAVSRGLGSVRVPDFVAIVAGYGPALAAVLITAVTSGKAGLSSLLRRLVRWRVGVRWYVAALFIPAAVHLVSTALYLLAGGVQAASGDLSQDLFGLSGVPAWQRLLLLFSIFVLGFDGLGEELGWRGFALPVLLKKYSMITASLILGLLWAFWHLPYALVEGSAMSNVPLIWHLLRILASSILITWIFVHTQGSVLLAILFHAAGNTTANFLPTLLPAAGDPQVSMISVGVQWLLVFVIMTLSGPAFFFSKPGARIEGGGVESGTLQ